MDKKLIFQVIHDVYLSNDMTSFITLPKSVIFEVKNYKEFEEKMANYLSKRPDIGSYQVDLITH